MTQTKKTVRVFTGKVMKAAMNKTIAVAVERTKIHPKYGKRYKVTRKFHVHDEKNEYKPGDQVSFIECRPLSKLKRWRVISKI